eukprot:CAMPEP_0182438584 /NCGR_PEP_ID=MMETSP1167-20130531/85874_1 /TAXON_ID=2988 /ORGANISM="Mallomonas Sp, Strain CCMP3275" /LENGTH=385 /DNA_ID=CAMNT_0024632015 /DNA_START=222 /DNA_END=1378 /DNA_ORIENTATION=-
MPAAEATIDLIEGKEFIIQSCKGNNLTSVEFVKGPKEEVITVDVADNNKMYNIHQMTKSEELKENTRRVTSECMKEKTSSRDFTDCVTNKLSTKVQKMADDKEEIEKYRNLISARLRNYTCADPDMKTSTPISTHEFTVGGKTYDIQTMFNTSHAKIWAIENFLTDEECNQFIEYGRPRLRRATVAAEDGSSTISENRKAQQAGYDLRRRPNDPPLESLSSYIACNKKTGFRLQPDGQEDFTIIQYNPTDQYTPHCDGACDGERANTGGRVATAVLYCKVAEQGGATSFTKADVFVNPKVGMATFFSYRGPDGLLDTGYTEHSGCPVIKGEKWAITFWMRTGVRMSNPWTVYDPSGVPILGVDEESYDIEELEGEEYDDYEEEES